MFKNEVRILGFDDSPFKRDDKTVSVVGVVYRGGNFLDGAIRLEVGVDGLDATDKISDFINSSRQKSQLKVLMFDGITLGGFNPVDIVKLNQSTGLPVIVVNRKLPDIQSVKDALEKNFVDHNKRWGIILNAGKIKTCRLNSGKQIHYQVSGLTDEEAEDLIRLSTTHSDIPEPLRVAHLIAGALVKGESSGRA